MKTPTGTCVSIYFNSGRVRVLWLDEEELDHLQVNMQNEQCFEIDGQDSIGVMHRVNINPRNVESAEWQL